MILRRDQGAIAPAVPLLALAILLLGGLVLDASRQLNARSRAVAYAEEAARAGASAVDLSQPELRLLPDDAIARARAYCDRVAATDPSARCTPVGIEAVGPDDPRRIAVRVRAEVRIPATLLGIVGVRELRASGEGRARPYEGVSAADAQ